MKALRSLALTASAVALAVGLSGCSLDAVIWGNDGARVIHTTDQLIADLAAGDGSDLLCSDTEANLGTARDWADRLAGEPERFDAKVWKEQVALTPQWSINVEGLPEGAVAGDMFPADVFYRETDDGLCVIDISWSRLGDIG